MVSVDLESGLISLSCHQKEFQVSEEEVQVLEGATPLEKPDSGNMDSKLQHQNGCTQLTHSSQDIV